MLCIGFLYSCQYHLNDKDLFPYFMFMNNSYLSASRVSLKINLDLG